MPENYQPNTSDYDSAITRRQIKRLSDFKFGWGGKSIGSRVMFNGTKAWARLTSRQITSKPDRIWDGEIEASEIFGVSKPRLLDVMDWTLGEREFRLTISTLAPSPVCSGTPDISRDVPLCNSVWLGEMKKSLLALSLVPTERVACRQDLVNRRVRERFGNNIETKVERWITVHGDLHWANLTAPKFCLLDWEGWGTGPDGHDVAFLLAYSSVVPPIMRRIERAFADTLHTSSGKVSVLFAVAELLRMIEKFGDHPHLKNGLLRLAARYIKA